MKTARAPWAPAMLALLLTTVAVAPRAHAALGEPMQALVASAALHKGARTQAIAVPSRGSAALPARDVQAQERVMDDGSRITEYAGADGIVFAVSWSTRFKPNLELLLGRHATTFAVAARDAMKTPGLRRHVVLQRDDLVVRSAGHLNTYTGRAYLRSRVPPDVDVDAIR